MIKHTFLFIGAVALVFAVACGKKDDSEAKKAGKQTAGKTMTKTEAALKARKIFKQRCVSCHGEGGKGDGIGAASLKVKPRDYTDPAWQKEVTDERIRNAVVKGGAAVGLSPNMTPNPDLGKPDKKMVLDEIVLIVRSFGG